MWWLASNHRPIVPARIRFREALEWLLISAIMRQHPRNRVPARSRGARVVVYHETPKGHAANFHQHLFYFSREYEVLSLEKLVEEIRRGGSPDGQLAITFDDGFKDHAEVAAPLLAGMGLPACFLVSTGWVSLSGSDARRIHEFRQSGFRRADSPPPVNWNDLQGLLQQGFTVGSHTRNHPDLTLLPPEQAAEEIIGSKRELKENLGTEAIHFAYPFGEARYFHSGLQGIVQSAGYETCLSAERGSNGRGTSVYRLRREHLDARWPLKKVRFFLESDYERLNGYWQRSGAGKIWKFLSWKKGRRSLQQILSCFEGNLQK